MTEDKSAKPRNLGKVEYRIIQPDVEKKQAEGYPALVIYDELINSGRLTMSYSRFCSYVRGHGERADRQKKKQKDRPPIISAAPPSFKNTPFTHNNVANLDELGPPKKS